MYSDQRDMKTKSKAPGQVNLINSLQLFICLQWRQLVLLTVEHMLHLKLSGLNTFPPKPYAETGMGISASPSHPHPSSFFPPSRQAHKEQFPAWQCLCLILFGVGLALAQPHSRWDTDVRRSWVQHCLVPPPGAPPAPRGCTGRWGQGLAWGWLPSCAGCPSSVHDGITQL